MLTGTDDAERVRPFVFCRARISRTPPVVRPTWALGPRIRPIVVHAKPKLGLTVCSEHALLSLHGAWAYLSSLAARYGFITGRGRVPEITWRPASKSNTATQFCRRRDAALPRCKPATPWLGEAHHHHGSELLEHRRLCRRLTATTMSVSLGRAQHGPAAEHRRQGHQGHVSAGIAVLDGRSVGVTVGA